jgi:hypothetical protein
MSLFGLDGLILCANLNKAIHYSNFAIQVCVSTFLKVRVL